MPDSAAFVLNLDAYFARIGYTGPREPTLATLTAIHQHHARAIPYENLDVLLGRPISLDPAAIERKLVHDRRGGYCFEQNGLFRDVLRALGFRVTTLIARVRWQIPPEVPTALTHMVLRIDLDGRMLLADVGFGSRSLLSPLPLDQFDRELGGSLEPRRLVQRGRVLIHQCLHDDAWADLYHFTLDEIPPVDFEVGNWFTSAHPQSRFKQNLSLARSGADCRYAILNREFITRYADGRADKHAIESPDELLALLAQYFGLHFPPGTRFGPPGSAWPS